MSVNQQNYENGDVMIVYGQHSYRPTSSCFSHMKVIGIEVKYIIQFITYKIFYVVDT